MDAPARTPRQRALRAARAATLGLVLATPGCYAAHEAPADRTPLVDAGSDDAGIDARVAAADECDPAAPDWAECCDAMGWPFERGCMAWGPFVPPSEGQRA